MRIQRFSPRLATPLLPGLLEAGGARGRQDPAPEAARPLTGLRAGAGLQAANSNRPAFSRLPPAVSERAEQPHIGARHPAPDLPEAAETGPDASALSPQGQRLAALRLTLARLETADRADPGAPLSLGDLDRHLPGGGLACGVLNEITASYVDRPAAFGFTLALAAIAQRARTGPAVFVAPRRATQDFGQPHAHGLKQLGLDAGRLILVETGSDKDALWAIEEALRTPGLSAVTAAVMGDLDLTSARRLNLAAAAHGTPLALLRIGKTATGPAATRWRIASAPAALDRHGAFLHWRWSVALERCRNGRPAHCLIEWNHVALRFHLVESLADRASAAQPGPAGLRRAV